MNLQLFADHCVPTILIKGLRGYGFPLHVLRDHLPINAPDEIVIEKARELDAVLLSLNGDFSDIIRFPPANYNGIVSLQVKDQPSHFPLFLSILNNYFSKYPAMDHYIGKLLLIELHRIRVRA